MAIAALFSANLCSQTLVALSPNAVEMLFAIGAGDRLVATVEFADYPEAARALPRIGRYDQLDLEALLLLAPDAVVISHQDTSPQLLEQLQRLGLPLTDVSVQRLDQIADRLEQLGSLTGLTDSANQEAAAFRQQLEHLRRNYADAKPVPLFYQVAGEPLITANSAWMNDIFASCGGRNLFIDSVSAYPQVSLEQVLLRRPEVILLPRIPVQPVSGGPDWSAWPELPAVAKDRVVEVNADWLHRAGPRVLMGVEQICRVLDGVRAIP